MLSCLRGKGLLFISIDHETSPVKCSAKFHEATDIQNTELRCDDQGLWKKRGFKFSLLYYVNSDINETKAEAQGSRERKGL
jgi:hypothetical protein